MSNRGIAPPEEIIQEARHGRMVVLVTEDENNIGHLVVPAQMATPTAINFMAKHARGLICLALTQRRADQLGLALMSSNSGTRRQNAFTVSIEARDGVTTGISAKDRARTISTAINTDNEADQIVTPGHVFPLVARDGGVLVQAGYTEAAVDVARLAGLNPSGVICAIMNRDGTIANIPDLICFAHDHDLKIGTTRDLISYRRRYDRVVECVAEARLVSKHGGEWRVSTYRNKADGTEHLALIKGVVESARPTLVSMHIASIYTDMLGEDDVRTGLLQRSMEDIGKEGVGVVVLIWGRIPDYLSKVTMQHARQEHEGLKDYGIGAQILADLGIHDIELPANTPHQTYIVLERYGLRIVGKRDITSTVQKEASGTYPSTV